MSKIKNKRDSLERFIREQILGPGINGYKFIDIENDSLFDDQMMRKHPIDFSDEIIDIMPAAVYSTGILFPKDDSKTEDEGAKLDNNEIDLVEEVENENTLIDANNQILGGDDIEETDTIQLDQMFPKTMGFTCCLNNSFLKGEFEVKLSTRYYSQLERKKDNNFNKKYGILCELPSEKFRELIRDFELNLFSVVDVKGSTCLLMGYLTSDEITEAKKSIRAIQKVKANEIFDRNMAYFEGTKITAESAYLSSLKSTLYYDLKTNVTCKDLRRELYSISQEIEIEENLLSHFEDLLKANGGGYGLWQSELIERTIRFNNISFPSQSNKLSLLYKDHYENITVHSSTGAVLSNGLKDIFVKELNERDGKASLSLNVQFSKDSRNPVNSDNVFVKFQLLNTSTAFKKEKNSARYYSTFNSRVNKKCFFGVKLILSSDKLRPYNQLGLDGIQNQYNEDETTRFVYRQFKDFAVGHGCSVKWNNNLNRVETEYIPTCDTPDVDPTPRNKNGQLILNKSEVYKDPSFLENSKALEFKWLSSFSIADDGEIISGLIQFVDSYKDWIEDKRKLVKSIEKKIATQELNKCSADYERMKSNIENFLSGDSNKVNMDSFRQMNSVMFMQLWHSVKCKNDDITSIIGSEDFTRFDRGFYEGASDNLFSVNDSASWRAFQLAFILLNLDGIFKTADDPKWEKRNNYVDLVWFPTGGGKTESYLGLIALTILNRRKLHGDIGGGTAAIMRYTLRLLTLQQFQRATIMIMALELMRRWNKEELGEEPIYIGLWVGNNSIPNKLVYSNRDSGSQRDSLQLEYEKLAEGMENRIPFDNCPWCKSKLIGDSNQDKDSNIYYRDRLHLKCSNNKCSFAYNSRKSKRREDQGPIPVNLCDETVYLHPPALLFGTVDKFAQLAHKVSNSNNNRNKDSRRIFGKGNWENGKPNEYLPPDLIIQDELHLLNGPLGSAVALFEAAVDQLCTRADGTRPKIISSTATTRNTSLQIAALFDRKVNIFPKQGVECDDSFFAFYKRIYFDNEKKDFEFESKRRYMGILPTGRTQIWMQMRLAAITLTHRALFELNELKGKESIDYEMDAEFIKSMNYFHTIISYFNSLKEVGKTQSQVQSYILKEIRRVFNRLIRPKKLLHSIYTYGPIVESELTGRLSGEEVKNELRKIEQNWNSKKRFAHSIDGETIWGTIPPEIVFATNMISVGIDVSRFNMIMMNSMPRNTAEYIQATSRVARETSGLVLTIHHPFRARDVSHYEKFIEFHEKMYSYVEPISVTPFTSKSVNRYFGAYLATMLRHRTSYVNRVSSHDLKESEFDSLMEYLTEYFENRFKKNSESSEDIQDLLSQKNVDYIRKWTKEALVEWYEKLKLTKKEGKTLVFNNKARNAETSQNQLYVNIDSYDSEIDSDKWQIPMSLRVIEPEAAVKINPE